MWTYVLAALLILWQPQPPLSGRAVLLPADELRLLDGEVTKELLANEIEGVLAAQPAADAGDLRQTLKRLNLSLRAGRRGEAALLVDHLGALRLDDEWARAVLAWLLNQREMELMIRLVERVPGSGREFSSNIMGYWLREARKSPQEIDSWLAERDWTSERVSLNTRLKTDAPLMTELVADARSRACTPTTLSNSLGYTKDASTPVNLDWVPGWCQTTLAVEARDLAVGAVSWNTAIAAEFFERALATPFTPEDVRRETSRLSVVPSQTDAEWERRFRSGVRVRLADAYRRAGNTARAEQVLQELRTENPASATDREVAELTGQVQSQLPVRVFELQTLAAEAANADSPDYWLSRAKYFAGRGERAQAYESFERALTLARAERSSSAWRVLQAYDEYLSAARDRPTTLRLFRRELESGPNTYDSWLFDALGRHLERDRRLLAEAEWLWPLLAARADWGDAASLLQHIVRDVPADERPAIVNRLETAAAGGGRERLLPLARAMYLAGEGGAAVRLFEQVKRETSGGIDASVDREATGARRVELRQKFRTEINRRDWRAGEESWNALLQVASGRLDTAFDFSSTAFAMVQLAEAAAYQGDGEAALTFWRRAVNLERASGLEHLAGQPMSRYRAELTAFYEALGKRDPASWVPPVALAKLRR